MTASGVRYALTYGLLSGLLIIATMLSGLLLSDQASFFSSAPFGYLVMLAALTLMFVGMRRYRDVEHGGVIRFLPAFRMGLAIAAVAALAYIAVWEAYLAATDYRFMDEYIADIVRARQAEGVSKVEIAEEVAGMEWMRTAYRNPLLRVAITFLELFPVGMLVALVSALLLRNHGFLPARR